MHSKVSHGSTPLPFSLFLSLSPFLFLFYVSISFSLRRSLSYSPCCGLGDANHCSSRAAICTQHTTTFICTKHTEHSTLYISAIHMPHMPQKSCSCTLMHTHAHAHTHTHTQTQSNDQYLGTNIISPASCTTLIASS